ncbi:MAG: HIT family protein [Bacteroidota bacterium]
MSGIFTKIVNGEIPCHKVAETDNCIAFLDINPLAKGHTLVIPKMEIDYVFSIDDDLYSDLMLFSKKVALAIEKVIECERIGVAVVGLEVPHTHIHLIPINNIYDIDFSKPKLQLSNVEFAEIAGKITRAFSA